MTRGAMQAHARTFEQLDATNCPMTVDLSPDSWNSTEETMAFSSSTVPQATQMASPLLSWISMSREPHDGHSISYATRTRTAHSSLS